MNKISGWLWPSISDHTSARRALMQGYWGACLLSVMFFGTGFLAVYTLHLGGPDHRWDFFDAFVFMIVGWMIKQGSKRFAIAGVVFCAFETWARFSFLTFPVWLLLLLWFINSVRGAAALLRFPPPVADPPAK